MELGVLRKAVRERDSMINFGKKWGHYMPEEIVRSSQIKRLKPGDKVKRKMPFVTFNHHVYIQHIDPDGKYIKGILVNDRTGEQIDAFSKIYSPDGWTII